MWAHIPERQISKGTMMHDQPTRGNVMDVHKEGIDATDESANY